MKDLFKNAYVLSQTNGDTREYWGSNADILCKEYPNIPHDIMEHFFVKHARDGKNIMTGIPNLDAHKIIVEQIELNKNELLNTEIIKFAPFADKIYPHEIKRSSVYGILEGKYAMVKNGTWSAPVVCIKKDNTYLILDGTTRFRSLVTVMVNKNDLIKDMHKINLLSIRD